MFNWFKKPNYNGTDGNGYQPLPTPTESLNTPPVEKTKSDPCFYTVGTTVEGRTVLRMVSEDGYTSLALTMSESAVKQMIRMLEATLPITSVEDEETDPFTCPGCGGPADNGHDRCIPPNPYYCTECEKNL